MTPNVLIAISGEVHTKSSRTRRRFRSALDAALRDAWARANLTVELSHDGVEHGRLLAATDEPEQVAEVAARVFGVQHVMVGELLPKVDRSRLLTDVAARVDGQLEDRTFAVRVERHGQHPWRSVDLEAEIGAALRPRAAGVDLESPDREVRVVVLGDRAWLVHRSVRGWGGLPPGVQGRVLTLFSGGYDSAVAAWKMMRRGCAGDLLHVDFGCGATDHAALLAWHLTRTWGAGTRPTLWVVDGEPIRECLLDEVPRRFRQVALKQLMLEVADHVAVDVEADAIVTGDAVGQVSSQTLANLRAMGQTRLPLLRPLAGDDKQDIIERARDIGVADIAARAREVCDFAGGRVVVAASEANVDEHLAPSRDRVLEQVIDTLRAVPLDAWQVGEPLTASTPAGAPTRE